MITVPVRANQTPTTSKVRLKLLFDVNLQATVAVQEPSELYPGAPDIPV